MPAGARPGGGLLFSTAGRNSDDAGISFAAAPGVLAGRPDALAAVFKRVVRAATTTATAMIATTTQIHALPKRLGGGTCLTGLERRLLIYVLR